jgi:carboxyl-terminal processing protease
VTVRTHRYLAILVALACAGAHLTPTSAQDATRIDCGDLLEEAWQAVADSYYDEAGLRARWDALRPTGDSACVDGAHAAIRDLLSGLDDRAVRLVPAPGAEAFLADMGGTTPVGIGLRELLSLDVDERTGLLTVVTSVPDGPAARAGIRTGDVIEAIDGVPADTMDLALAMALLRGAAGTELELRLRRDGATRTVRVTRERLPSTPKAVLRMLEAPGAGPVAYLRPPDFSPGTAEALTGKLALAASRGAVGVILDLRDNPGGFVGELTGAAGLFLPAGTPVARVRSRPERDTVLETAADRAWERPLVVLINRGSASAAEALAGAIQAAGRGVVLGGRSFGKGLAHFATPLSDGSLVLAPSGRLETPHGRDVLDEGIEPDRSLPAPSLSTAVPDFATDTLVREALHLAGNHGDQQNMRIQFP